MTTSMGLSKQDYIMKKYLSGGGEEKKKKKKGKTEAAVKKPNGRVGLRVIDPEDEHRVRGQAGGEEEGDALLETGEDAPVIENLGQINQSAQFHTGKWRTLDADAADSQLPVFGPSYPDSQMPSTSAPRRRRHDSSGDSDVTRSRRKNDAGDSRLDTRNKAKRRSQDSDSDLSPERHKSVTNDVPAAKKRRHYSGSDSDLSLERHRSVTNNDTSGRRHVSSDSDLSPVRAQPADGNDSDLSPPRRSDTKDTRRDKTLAGAKAGLQSGKELKAELVELRRKQDKQFAKMSADVSGQNAETVRRNQRDIRGSKAVKKELTEEEKQRKEVMKQKYDLWGRGLKQARMGAERAAEVSREMDKPVARYEDDADLDAHHRALPLHNEDPMLAYMQKQQAKQRGPAQEYPKYSGPPPPPNRFKLAPGYRWDGVDRSNGFEAKLMMSKNSQKAQDSEHYKWSYGAWE